MTEETDGGRVDRTVGRWYSVTRDGLACLCLDQKNAEEMSSQCDRDYPMHAPHKAMRLVDADGLDSLRAENERLRDDAARYRFLRDGENWPAVFGASSDPEPLRGWLLDEAVRLGMKHANKTPNALLSRKAADTVGKND